MTKIKSSEVMPFLAMVLVQLGYASMNVSSKMAMEAGMPPLVLVAYRQMFATVVIIPFAYILERKTMPKITWQILFQIFLCSLCGATLNQIFYFVGLKNSTPTISCALSNLLPAITFLLAIPFGLEVVGIKRRGGQAKVLGTVVCIGGAMLLTLYHGPMLNIPQPNFHFKYIEDYAIHRKNNLSKHPNSVLGPLCVTAANVAMAAWFIIQAKMSGSFAAPYTSSALLCFMASLQCTVVAVCTHHKLSDWSLVSPVRLLASIIAAVGGTALALSLMAWSIQRKGPLYVSVFSPLLLLIIALLSWTLRMENLYVGTLMGSVLIVVGLYAVLWGKSKEMSYENKTDTNVLPEQMIDGNGVLGMEANGTDLERQQQLVEFSGKPGDQQPSDLDLNGISGEHQAAEVNGKPGDQQCAK